MIAPKIHYPGRFENGLLGVQCVEPIEYHEAYLYVPYKLALTTHMVDSNPVLAEITRKYDIFAETAKEVDQCKLTLLLLFEYQKGEEGFWWPYLDLLPDFEHIVWELDRTLYVKEA